MPSGQQPVVGPGGLAHAASKDVQFNLTEKGIDLWPVTVALMHWGDRHYPAEGGSPRVILHRDCGGELTRHLTCAKCGAELGPRDVVTESGPGDRAHPPDRSVASAAA